MLACSLRYPSQIPGRESEGSLPLSKRTWGRETTPESIDTVAGARGGTCGPGGPVRQLRAIRRDGSSLAVKVVNGGWPMASG